MRSMRFAPRRAGCARSRSARNGPPKWRSSASASPPPLVVAAANASSMAARRSANDRAKLVADAFGPRDLRLGAIGNARTVEEGVLPLAGLELVFDGHRTSRSTNGHVDDDDIVRIIP